MTRPPTTTERGYGHDHQQERERWRPVVERGEAWCQQGIPGNGSSGTCLHDSRWIIPGTRWALGHNDARTEWIGPVHADCNASDGGKRRSRPEPQPQPEPQHPAGW
jgi:hypothetical protein